jgi:FAD-dependent urate hydroxylase
VSDDCEVAVIGAGPYGLAAAAHLKSAGVDTRIFGRPMSFRREHMPAGMRLRSPWIATDSLDVFAQLAAFAPQDPLPIERFVQYGDWFQRQAVHGMGPAA